jgi:type I restriction enzyme S subunit
MIDEWRKCKWGDIVILEYGKGIRNYENNDGPYLVYGTNGVIGKYSVPLCNHPGVIIGRKGAYRGVHYSSKPFYVIDTAFYLEPKEDIDLRWAYYELLMHDINSMDSGSAIPSTSRDAFYSLPVNVPPLHEQHTIASILSFLDEKIVLNRQVNQTLEAVVKAIYKSWFVDFDPVRAKMEGRNPYGIDAETAALFPEVFKDSQLGRIPKGWKPIQLNGIASFIKGISYKSENLRESKIALVTLKSVDRGGGYREEGLKPYTGEFKPEQQLQPGEIVVAHTDLTQAAEVLGRAARVRYNQNFHTLVASLDLVIVRPSEIYVSNEFLYGLLSQVSFQEYAYSYANGTTVLHLSARALPEYQFVLPPTELIEKYTTLACPLYQMMDRNEESSFTLATIRDTLLPKLLSGETRGKKANKYVEVLP